MREQEILYPLTNEEFLRAIARDLHSKLGADYEIISQGYGEDKVAQ